MLVKVVPAVWSTRSRFVACGGMGVLGCAESLETSVVKPRAYLETSVLSYLTSWPSRDLVRAAHQEVTLEWWAGRS